VESAAVSSVVKGLCTIMDGVQASELEVAFSHETAELEWYGFDLPGHGPGKGIMIGFWREDSGEKNRVTERTNILFKNIRAGKVVGVDVAQGVEQELEFEETERGVLIRDVLIRDYPVMIKVMGTVWIGHLDYH